MSVGTIGAYERGVRAAPSPDSLERLAAALRLTRTSRTDLERAARRTQPTLDDFGVRAAAVYGATDALPPDLPAYTSPFVGRTRELSEIDDLLRRHRVVTLVGAGGIGKTRTAVRLAATVRERGERVAVFIGVARLASAGTLWRAIASALKVDESIDRALDDAVLTYLRHRRMLLVLDGCEHLADGVARVVERIVTACPHVGVLATSRQRLGVGGESAYRLPALAAPPPDAARGLPSARALAHDAVALFAARAEAAEPRFRLTRCVAVVAAICRRLDGIPLAIELAAAHVKATPVRALFDALDARLAPMRDDPRTALSHEATMREVLHWSDELLSDAERRVLALVCVFSGGFSAPLACALAAKAAGMPERVVLDALFTLVEKSLMQAHAADGDVRYRLPDAIRRHARDKLIELREYDGARRAHAEALLTLAERLDSRIDVPSDREWASVVAAETDNWRAALEWAFSPGGDVSLARRLAAVRGAVSLHPPSVEALECLEAALSGCDDDVPAAVRARLELGYARAADGVIATGAGAAAAKRALRYFEQARDVLGIADARLCIALHVLRDDRAAAERLIREAYDAACAYGAKRLRLLAIATLGVALLQQRDIASTRRAQMAIIAELRAADAHRLAALESMRLADVEFRDGNAAEAIRVSTEAFPALRAAGSKTFANVLVNCAAYLTVAKRFDEARAYARQAAAISQDHSLWSYVWALQHLASATALDANAGGAARPEVLRRSARVLGFCDARAAGERHYAEQLVYDHAISALRGELGVQLDALMHEGARWAEDQAVAAALAL